MVYDQIKIPDKERRPRPSFKEFSDAVRPVVLVNPLLQQQLQQQCSSEQS